MATSTTSIATPAKVAFRGGLIVQRARHAARNVTYQIAVLTFLGALLRRYHLGDESFWFDEADIVQRARLPLSDLLQGFTQAGENGPLYTVILHYWLALIDAFPPLQRVLQIIFGASYEGPVRGLAMLFGVAAIPLMYLLARKVGGHWIGIIAATLLTVNPFHIWHSQDAKMYSLLVLMTLASTLLYILAWERNRTAIWAAYVVATWIMLTVHSMAGLVLLAHIASTPFMARNRKEATRLHSDDTQPEDDFITKIQNPKKWIRWGWAMLLILTPLFPIAWLRLAALVTDTADLGGWYTPASLTDIVGTVAVSFAVNRSIQPWEAIAAVLMAVLEAVGVYVILMSRTRSNATSQTIKNSKFKIQNSKFKNNSALVFALLIIPLSVFWVVTLKVPLFQARYLIMALPPYLILVSVGLLGLSGMHRRMNIASGLATALLGFCTFVALTGINYSPQPQKEDWRGAMVYVNDHLRLRDEIVVFPGYLASAVDVYYTPGESGRVPTVPIKAVPSLGIENFRQRELEEVLRNTVKCQERAWLITSPVRQEQEDPENYVEEWFTGNWHTFDRKEFNGVTVYGISFNGQPNCWYPNPDFSEQHAFANGLEFLGYIYELRADTTTQPDASYFPLTLYWRNPEKLMVDYSIRVQVKNSAGKVVADEALGPLNGYWPTSDWPPGTQVIDYRDIRLPGGLTPGDYTVTIQLYPKGHPDELLRLTEGGTEIVLREPLKIVPWTP
ncbi:MAG: glycosyltransferase family 39 protein [Chloroflexia bacterium]